MFRHNYNISSDETKAVDKVVDAIHDAAEGQAAAEVVVRTFDDIYDAAPVREDPDKQIKRQTGGKEEARRQFYEAVDPVTVTDNGEGILTGQDKETGRTLIYRERSTDTEAEAVVEEHRSAQSGRGTRSRKVRFDPAEVPEESNQ
jgi:hypothetical protein